MHPTTSRRKRILGYTNELTVRAGQRIEFKISVDGGAPYTAQLVRLINGDTHSEVANFKEVEIESPVNGAYEGRFQPVATGSCIVVEGVDILDRASELTVVVNVMPTSIVQGSQHIIGRWDDCSRAGWSLRLDERGQLALICCDGRGPLFSTTIAQPLATRSWYAAMVRISWRIRTARLECFAVGSAGALMRCVGVSATEQLGAYPSTTCPLTIAAAVAGRDAGGRVVPVDCFNGRIEAPVIYQGMLSDAELRAVAAGKRPVSLRSRLLADWNFGHDMSSTRIKDLSVNQLHGEIHNLPLRAVRGSRWNGSTMEWRHAPDQYAAIHFHSDALHDCGWSTSISYEIPDDLGSAIYALRLRRHALASSDLDEEYVPFFVAAPKDAPRSRTAVVIPTYTYLAYGNVRFLEAARKHFGKEVEEFYRSLMLGPGSKEYALLIEEHPELGSSPYDRHVDGDPVHFSSWLRPLLNMRPKSILWTFCADLLLIDWLTSEGFDHDIVTDDLLQQEGLDLLKNYSVVITGNHPEYQTTEQLDAYESYVDQGGHLMYLGGNGYYWRTSVHDSIPGVIEVRRGRTGTGTWQSEVGEGCFAFSGAMGGIWRELGRPPQRLVGVGFIAEGLGASYYRVLPEARNSAAAFILEGVDDDIIGNFGIFEGGSAGQEIDRSSVDRGTPANIVVLARSENHGPDMLYVIEEMANSYPVIDRYRPLTYAEMTFFETPKSGAVFSVGSMTWCGSLSHNGGKNNVAKITANVINRLSSSAPTGLR